MGYLLGQSAARGFLRANVHGGTEQIHDNAVVAAGALLLNAVAHRHRPGVGGAVDVRRDVREDHRAAREVLGAEDPHERRVGDGDGARVRRGDFDTALVGDVLKKRDSGGLFDCESVEVDSGRVGVGEVDPTGPMLGRKMRAVTGDAETYESTAATDFGLSERQLSTLLRWNNGSRRVARIVPESLALTVTGDVLEASFFLRKGCFATVILAELAHPPDGDLRRRD